MTATAATRARQRQQENEQRRALLEHQRQQRRTRRVVLVAGGVVVAVVAAFVLIGAVTSPSPAPSVRPNAVPLAVLADLTGVPDSTLAAVGAGTAINPAQVVSNGGVRTADGKPQVLYLGAEYCPFCAGQRWVLVQALSRFGHFMNLRTTRSAAGDVHPNTATFTFHGATYMSDYLSFTARELYTNVRSGSGYTPLDHATVGEAALLKQYGGSFPLLDLGGRYVQVGASYNLDLLHGLNWQQIAGALADPGSDIARAIDGSANVLTASLCKLTNDQPATACNAPAVQAINAH